jgi:hypothetical protein
MLVEDVREQRIYWPKKWEGFMICTLVNSVFGLLHRVVLGDDADASRDTCCLYFERGRRTSKMLAPSPMTAWCNVQKRN